MADIYGPPLETRAELRARLAREHPEWEAEDERLRLVNFRIRADRQAQPTLTHTLARAERLMEENRQLRASLARASQGQQPFQERNLGTSRTRPAPTATPPPTPPSTPSAWLSNYETP